jgi:hypothetical protein
MRFEHGALVDVDANFSHSVVAVSCQIVEKTVPFSLWKSDLTKS